MFQNPFDKKNFVFHTLQLFAVFIMPEMTFIIGFNTNAMTLLLLPLKSLKGF